MDPRTAALICGTFVVCVLAFDFKQSPSVSKATWVPLLWILIMASRPVAQWFDTSAGAFLANPGDGTPMDRNLLTCMIAAALVILARRNTQWGAWLARNPWVFALFIYAGLSVLWSEYPAVAIKRWFRGFGSVLMILVILSEKDPTAATAAVIRRCAWILVPASLVLVKYYRDLAVVYNTWTGEEYLVGVSTDKNGLGRLCLVSGIFAFWELFVYRAWARAPRRLVSIGLHVSLFGLILWMLRASHSSTSLGCVIFGSVLFLIFGILKIERRSAHLGTIILLGGGVMALLALGTDLLETAIAGLGRDMTLTDRVFIWRDLLEMGTNPVLGVGYDSFWLGERLDRFIRVHQVNEAHNGYIEIYVELGIVGLILFAGVLISAFSKAKESLTKEPAYGKLRLVVVAVCLLYNVTEAADKATTFIFFMLLLVAMDRPVERRVEGEDRERIKQRKEPGPEGFPRTSVSPRGPHGQGARSQSMSCR
jgi:O-antigen ligase